MTSIALVTGASSGMGNQAALRLWERGVRVYAAARRSMPDLEVLGVRTLHMDVTSEDSISEGMATLLRETGGRLDILVNDAGYGSFGTIEEVPISEARHQFEVNVFGAMRLVQLVLPTMLAAGHGRIVNVSSIGGLFATAPAGWYHATKYSIEALSDVLRQEVGPHGVEVVLVEPGLIRTDFMKIAAQHMRQTSGLGRYSALVRGYADAFDFIADGYAGTDPAVLGKVIANAATTKRPRARYRRGFGAIMLPTAHSLLPDKAFDAAMVWSFSHLDQIVAAARKVVGGTNHSDKEQ
ncbi:MAG: SDR family NAD(P)-dependent oxidoreductase [Propionibacteriaceae bacterium]|jgi:NAD(P)-dependent dehydrogenase (short-subunit alcohol dehydrogenase family)|nr:SDR family NAD(P)-dependent oxidoreductase [Propionibacteriaceae bacterium]